MVSPALQSKFVSCQVKFDAASGAGISDSVTVELIRMMMAIIWHSLRRNETWTLKTQKTVWQTTAIGYDLSRHICSCSGKIDGLVYSTSAVKFGCNDSSENGVWACCQMVSRVKGTSQICKKNASIKQGTRQTEGVGATGAHNRDPHSGGKRAVAYHSPH